MAGVDDSVDILESSRLAAAVMRAVRQPRYDSPYEWHETEKELMLSLQEYGQEIVRATRAMKRTKPRGDTKD